MPFVERSATIEFWTLGTFALRDREGRECSRLLARRKCLAFLAYLAASTRSHVQSRDALLALFWPDADEEHARLALRQLLHVIRRELGPGIVASRGSAMIGLAEGRVWCDLVAFEDALRAGNHARALELYRGDFLPGMSIPSAPEFERWMVGERTRLRARATAAAWMLAEEMELLRAAPHAVHWARRAVELAPDDEQGVRRYVALLDRLGDSARALRAYEDFARWLAASLGIEPSAETKALAESIRSRARTTPPSGIIVPGESGSDSGYGPEPDAANPLGLPPA